MFLQNLFVSIATRRRRLVPKNLEKTGAQLPKRWQELLDVAHQKPIKACPTSRTAVCEPGELQKRESDIASSPPHASGDFRDGWGL